MTCFSTSAWYMFFDAARPSQIVVHWCFDYIIDLIVNYQKCFRTMIEEIASAG
jgi:hypothetical protein